MILHTQPRRNNKKTFAIHHENETYFVSDAIKKDVFFQSAKTMLMKMKLDTT